MYLIFFLFNKYRNFIFFGISGTLGFVVDSFCYLIFSYFFSYYIARCFSFFIAIVFTWIFNRTITFKDNPFKGSIIREFVSYLLSMIVGGSANYFAFIILMNYSYVVSSFPVLGIAAGAFVGLFINFALSQFVLYKK